MIDLKSEDAGQMELIERHDIDDEEDLFDENRKLISQGINAGDVNKLQDAGIRTCNSLMMQIKKIFSAIKGLTEAKVKKICEAAKVFNKNEGPDESITFKACIHEDFWKLVNMLLCIISASLQWFKWHVKESVKTTIHVSIILPSFVSELMESPIDMTFWWRAVDKFIREYERSCSIAAVYFGLLKEQTSTTFTQDVLSNQIAVCNIIQNFLIVRSLSLIQYIRQWISKIHFPAHTEELPEDFTDIERGLDEESQVHGHGLVVPALPLETAQLPMEVEMSVSNASPGYVVLDSSAQLILEAIPDYFSSVLSQHQLVDVTPMAKREDLQITVWTPLNIESLRRDVHTEVSSDAARGRKETDGAKVTREEPSDSVVKVVESAGKNKEDGLHQLEEAEAIAA